MAALKPGTAIAVPCELKPGPFSDERLITVNTVDGPNSGFVQTYDLKETGGKWFVRGYVVKDHRTSLEVRIRGSFFNTNGVASISRDEAVAA
jgi:hypothetical protein